jgi:hypothetical protein
MSDAKRGKSLKAGKRLFLNAHASRPNDGARQILDMN